MQHLPRIISVLVGVLCFISTLRAEVSAVDDLGRTITLPSTPQRIVSLTPSITETLFAIGAGDQIVGDTDYCNYPAEATKKQRIGGVINPSIETIIGLKPDLIILSMEGNVREDFGKLKSIDVPIFVTNPRTLRGIHKSLKDLGVVTGHDTEADRFINAMQRTEDSIAALPSKTATVLLVVSLQPLIVVGSKTFLAELLELAGGVNIAGKSPSTYPTLSREAVVAANPDVVIVMSDALNTVDNLLDSFPEWKNLSAFINHKMFRIDSDIASRPGPRAVDGLITLHRIIHEGRE